MKRKEKTIPRRRFMKQATVGVAAVSVAPAVFANPKTGNSGKSKSRVVMASHSQIVDTSEQINTKLVRIVVDEALIALTDTTSVQDAWAHLFPHLQSTDVIGIKVNSANSSLPSHPQVVYALAQSFVESLHVNPNNIIIWDRYSDELTRAKYTLNQTNEGIRCFGTIGTFASVLSALSSDADESEDENIIGYDKSFAVDVGEGKQMHLSKILTEMCTYLINVPVLKESPVPGVTLSLKNHYGSIDSPSLCHAGGCDPYIANLNNTPQIRDKTKLIVCDALFGIYQFGPIGPPHWINRQLLLSIDPVALDYTGMLLIDQQRREKNLPLVSEGTPHIRTAAALGLGTNDPQQMDIVDVQLG